MSEQTPNQEPQNQNNENTQGSRNDSNQNYSETRKEERQAKREAKWEYRNANRGSDGIGVGVTFIFIGVIWMLAKLGYINFSIIGAIVDLWPLIFVVIGVNIIFKRVAYISLLTWVGFLTAVVAYGMYFQPQDRIFESDVWTDMPAASASNLKTISGSIPMEGNEAVKEANLELNLAAANLSMGMSEDQLIDYVIPEKIVNTKFDVNGSNASFTFSEKNNTALNNLARNNVGYDLFLNKNVLWYIDVNMGAADCKLNFSEVPVRDLEINGGAGDFDLEVSDLQDKADISINMAAGDANIVVPENVGIKISVNGVISDNNFSDQGLNKINGAFETPDYDKAERTIFIEINSAASDITLERR